MAHDIETSRTPSSAIEVVHRTRLALRGIVYTRETYTRLMVLEALHQATQYSESLGARQQAPNAQDSLDVAIARGLLEGVCPGVTVESPEAWRALLNEWRIGRGAPRKGDPRRKDRLKTKWDRLALLLWTHIPACPKVVGNTLEAEWGSWKKTDEHLPVRAKVRAASRPNKYPRPR